MPPETGDAMPSIVAPLADSYLSMVLLVDDQLLIGEAVRRSLIGEPDIDFHYCANPLDAVRTAGEVQAIVLPTKDEASTKSEAFRAGANDYLVKLPDRIELVARVRYHSRAYLDHVQRDAAYNALRESQRQLINANLELQKLTRIDGLTNLANRRYFDEYIQAEWRRAIRTRMPMSLLMIDVDNFKLYNDAYGHLAGDEVLKKVAGVIQTGANRASDLAARFGGEEFTVILTDTDLAGAGVVAHRLVERVRDLAIPHGKDRVSISVGVASVVPQDGLSIDDAINAADLALFRAKTAGRDRVELHAAG